MSRGAVCLAVFVVAAVLTAGGASAEGALRASPRLATGEPLNFCDDIRNYLPSQCSTNYNCTSYKCSFNLMDGDVQFTLYADVKPCAMPAYIDFGIQVFHPENLHWQDEFEAGHTFHVPVPGATFGVDDLEAGLYIDANINGDAANLGLKLGVDACADVDGDELCGEDVPGLDRLLPVWLFDGHYQFDGLCN